MGYLPINGHIGYLPINGPHLTYFDANDNHEVFKFYEYVCGIMLCSIVDAGERLQELLVQWLERVCETRAAVGPPSGFTDIGPVLSRDTGCWPTEALPSRVIIKASSPRGGGIAWLAHGGIAITGNNQGLESTWRRDPRISGMWQRLGGAGQRLGFWAHSILTLI